MGTRSPQFSAFCKKFSYKIVSNALVNGTKIDLLPELLLGLYFRLTNYLSLPIISLKK